MTTVVIILLIIIVVLWLIFNEQKQKLSLTCYKYGHNLERTKKVRYKKDGKTIQIKQICKNCGGNYWKDFTIEKKEN